MTRNAGLNDLAGRAPVLTTRPFVTRLCNNAVRVQVVERASNFMQFEWLARKIDNCPQCERKRVKNKREHQCAEKSCGDDRACRRGSLCRFKEHSDNKDAKKREQCDTQVDGVRAVEKVALPFECVTTARAMFGSPQPLVELPSVAASWAMQNDRTAEHAFDRWDRLKYVCDDQFLGHRESHGANMLAP